MQALPQGQYVKHYRYGFGVITVSDQEETAIEFELHGSKRFVTRLMVVELSDLTPPERFRAKWVKAASGPPSLRKAAIRRAVPKLPGAAVLFSKH